MLDRKYFPNQKTMCTALVDLIIDLARNEINLMGKFHLALTGGEVGGIISKNLALAINDDPDAFKGLHIWWSDERFVAQDSSERNSRAFLDSLTNGTMLHIHESTPADFNIDVETSARRYAADLFDVEMDLTLLSIGTDGHVASLFPSQWQFDEKSAVVAVHNAPKKPAERVSFSMTKINSSTRVWLLASGDAKKSIVERVCANDPLLPATYSRGIYETWLFADQKVE